MHSSDTHGAMSNSVSGYSDAAGVTVGKDVGAAAAAGSAATDGKASGALLVVDSFLAALSFTTCSAASAASSKALSCIAGEAAPASPTWTACRSLPLVLTVRRQWLG